MSWNILTPILIWAGIFIPTFILLLVFPPKVKLTAIFIVLAFAAANLFFVLTVNWALINYWLRLLPVLMTFILIIRFWLATRKRYIFELDKVWRGPWLPEKKPGQLAALAAGVVLLLVSLVIDLQVLRSLSFASYQGQPVMLFYPLRYGLYIVVNGGNGLEGVGMNNAYRDLLGRETGSYSQAYAVDMMKMINNRGMIAQGILPRQRQDYETYNDIVFSPCVGKVVYVEDGHPDSVFGKPEAPLGNRVVIQCFEYYVTVANLRKDSIMVDVGDEVYFTYQLGQVGSSGEPSLPHLRVFTTLNGWEEGATPVPQIFDLGFRFLVRNDLTLPDY